MFVWRILIALIRVRYAMIDGRMIHRAGLYFPSRKILCWYAFVSLIPVPIALLYDITPIIKVILMSMNLGFATALIGRMLLSYAIIHHVFKRDDPRIVVIDESKLYLTINKSLVKDSLVVNYMIIGSIAFSEANKYAIIFKNEDDAMLVRISA